MSVRIPYFASTVIAVLALTLAGCAKPTPYTKAVDGFGYREQAIESDRYRVSFSANSLTAREVVENYTLFRAAELTRQAGMDHFILVEKITDKDQSYQTYSHCPYYDVYRDKAHPAGVHYVGPCSATTVPFNEFKASVVILMRPGAAPDRGDAYDARDVIKRLGPTVIRPKS